MVLGVFPRSFGLNGGPFSRDTFHLQNRKCSGMSGGMSANFSYAVNTRAVSTVVIGFMMEDDSPFIDGEFMHALILSCFSPRMCHDMRSLLRWKGIAN